MKYNNKNLNLFYFLNNKHKKFIYKTLFFDSVFIKFIPSLKKTKKRSISKQIKHLRFLNLK